MSYQFCPDFIINIESFGGLLFERGGTPAWELDSCHAGFLKIMSLTGDCDSAVKITRRLNDAVNFEPDLQALLRVGVIIDGKAPDQTCVCTPEQAEKHLRQEYALAQSRANLKAPTTLTLYPDLRCQQNCSFCFVSADKKRGQEKTRKTQAWSNLIHEAKNLGVSSIALLGGEPTLYDGVTDIIKTCLELDINLGITSNGQLVSREIIDLLTIGDNVLMCFSLESMSSDLHRHYTGIGNENVIETMERFHGAGIPFNVNTVGLGQDIHDLEMICDFCAHYGARVWFLNMYYSKGEVPAAFPGYRWYADVDRHLQNFVTHHHPNLSYQMFGCQLYWTYPEDKRKQGPDKTIYNRLVSGCAAGQNQLEILPDGTAMPCMQMDKDSFGCGNVFDNGLEKIWNDSEVLRFLRHPSSPPNHLCADCSWFASCQGGCVERRRQSVETFNAQIDPRCPQGFAEILGVPESWSFIKKVANGTP